MTESTKNSLIGASAVIVAAIIGGLSLYFSRSNSPVANTQSPTPSISPYTSPTKPDAAAVKSNDAQSNYGRIFNDGDPYPIGFDKVKLGTPVPVLKSIYPDGDFGVLGSYDIHPKDGPFSLVAFWYDEETKSPKVENISLHYRDSTVRDELRKQAISAFGSKSVSTRVNGTLTWPNVQRCSIEVGPSWMSIDKSGT